jgi:hypothetical protein
MDIPAFLIIPQDRRKQAWVEWLQQHHHTSAHTQSGRVETETERLWRTSRDRDKAKRDAINRPKYDEQLKKWAAINAEKKAIKAAVKFARGG